MLLRAVALIAAFNVATSLRGFVGGHSFWNKPMRANDALVARHVMPGLGAEGAARALDMRALRFPRARLLALTMTTNENVHSRHDSPYLVDGRELEVRAATPEEMTTLVLKGEWLPNLLAPVSQLCARVLYGATSLQSAVAMDFQRRYGMSRMNRGVLVIALLKGTEETAAIRKGADEMVTPIEMAPPPHDVIVGCLGMEILALNPNGQPPPPSSVFKRPDGTAQPQSALWNHVRYRPLLSNLAVSEQYRRRGIARMLMCSAEDIAHELMGFDEILLKVEDKNTPFFVEPE